MLADRLLRGLEENGFQGRIVPVGRMSDLGKDIASLREAGMIDAALCDDYPQAFKFSLPEQMPDAKSVVVASRPQPKIIIHFTVDGEDVPAVVPPTYANALDVIDSAKAALERSARPGPGRFERAALPLKTLAARTGLVRYGRNNITYVPQHGSFHRLVAFFTDLELGIDDWQERQALPACRTCRKCLEACPANVIAEDRFLIHAERCITWFNEMPSERPFPTGYGAGWHNAIVGCMICQDACPYNKAVKGWSEEGERFSAAETDYLLRGVFEGERAKAMQSKLDRCGLDLSSFPRNLRALLTARTLLE
jgi:epoxyqueuosine reductase